MKPKQWIKYIKKLEKQNMAICDGMTENYNLDTFFYILYLLGIPFFMWIGWKLKGFVEGHKK